jgi:hypothetical protein
VSEHFRFATSWREIPADKVEREWARTWTFDTYDQALGQHKRACWGRWVTDVMVDPQVGDLIGVDSGKTRVIRAAVDLWTDDRPSMSKEQFGELWRAFLRGEERRAA